MLSHIFPAQDYSRRSHFLKAVITCCDAATEYAHRYALLALDMAKAESDSTRRMELLRIAENCAQVPGKPARSFYEACQSFWFVQMLLQTESSGHSISPGRFDQYMYPFYRKDIDEGRITDDEVLEQLEKNINRMPYVTQLLEIGYSPEKIIGIIGRDLDVDYKESLPVEFKCRCSRERILDALASLDAHSLEEMSHDEITEAHCQFCNTTNKITADEIKELLKNKQENE